MVETVIQPFRFSDPSCCCRDMSRCHRAISGRPARTAEALGCAGRQLLLLLLSAAVGRCCELWVAFDGEWWWWIMVVNKGLRAVIMMVYHPFIPLLTSNVVKNNAINQPGLGMVYTSYKHCEIGDGLWHCFTVFHPHLWHGWNHAKTSGTRGNQVWAMPISWWMEGTFGNDYGIHNFQKIGS